MKTKRMLSVGLVLVGLVSVPDALAFYNPSTGRWLNRDPIGEHGGVATFAFAANAPTIAHDNLGLAAGGPSYTIVNLSPPTGWWMASLGDVEFGSSTYLGFRSRYLPTDGRGGHPVCPCKKENIILVQAVYDAFGYAEHIDDSPDPRFPAPHKPGDPIHEYYWDSRPPEGPLTIVDRPNTSGDLGTWEFEDCAVCRTHPKPGTTLDQVMGCVRFTFKRIDLNHAKLTIHTRDGDTNARAVNAEFPGKLWAKALKNWK